MDKVKAVRRAYEEARQEGALVLVKIARTLVALLAALAAVLALPVWPAHQASAAGSPRLILFISVDQMRYDYLTRFAPLYRGGFKTLLERGAIFSNALYRHGNTETGRAIPCSSPAATAGIPASSRTSGSIPSSRGT